MDHFQLSSFSIHSLGITRLREHHRLP